MFIKRTFNMDFEEDYLQNIFPLLEDGHTANEVIQDNRLIGWEISE